MTTPRGIRNNNPGNLRHGDNWRGLAVEQTDDAFCQFVLPEYGIRALAKTLTTYQQKYGLNSIGDIIKRWAPSNENDTTAYIASVCHQTRRSANAPIDLSEYKAMRALLVAIITHENGEQPYSDKQIDDGLLLADIRKPA